jgi:hypothetical protein
MSPHGCAVEPRPKKMEEETDGKAREETDDRIPL